MEFGILHTALARADFSGFLPQMLAASAEESRAPVCGYMVSGPAFGLARQALSRR